MGMSPRHAAPGPTSARCLAKYQTRLNALAAPPKPDDDDRRTRAPGLLSVPAVRLPFCGRDRHTFTGFDERDHRVTYILRMRSPGGPVSDRGSGREAVFLEGRLADAWPTSG